MDSKRFETTFFIILFLATLTVSVLLFLPYLGAVILALTFALMFEPVHRQILRRANGRETLAALLSLCVIVIAVFAPLTLFGYQIFRETTHFYSSLSENGGGNLQFLQEQILIYFPNFSLDLGDGARQAAGWILQNLGSFFSGISRIILKIFVMLFALYYFLKDGKKLEHFIITRGPLPRESSEKIIEKMKIAINSVVKGSLIVAVVQGILAGAGFFIFGIPNPAFWALFATITALVPAVGTGLVVVPAALYLFIFSDPISGIGLMLWGMLIVGLIDNFLRPKLIERGVKIHPFLILLSVLGGISFFGPLGFLLGPLVISLLFALLDMYPMLILKREHMNGEQ